MKKIISAVLAGAMCLGAFVSCGDKEESGKSGGALSAKGKSEYVSIMPLDGNSKPIRESVDGGIKYSMQLAEDFQKETDAEYNPYVIKFSGNKFLMPSELGSYGFDFYDGTFSVKNGDVKFSYENDIRYDIDDEEYKKININEKVEVDEDILDRSSEKLKGLPEEEKILMLKNEQKKMATNAAVERMEKLTQTGAYCKYAVPSMNYSDKWNDYAVLPFICFARPNGSQMNSDIPNTLKTVDKFLCTDTYGIELKGKYKRGKHFTLEHDLEETIKKDEQSPYQIESDQNEWLDRTEERAESHYGCDSLESTIEFSDGEWEWFNDDGELMNNGKYEESRNYPGLIKMYIDEDSKKCPDFALYTYPLWFYIDGDGEIYYPAFVKVE